MQAMILAAGFGTRLLPYTRLRPKPLFPLLNIPLLLLTVRHLQGLGFNHIVVNCHHLSEQIVASLQGVAGVTLQVEEKILGTGGGLGRAVDLFADEPVLVTNGDIYHTIDLAGLYQVHLDGNAEVTMAMHDFPRFNSVSVVDDSVVGFGSRKNEKQLAFTGVHIVDPKVLQTVNGNMFSSIIDRYRELSCQPGGIAVYRVGDCFWTDMGTKEDYLALHAGLLGKTIPAWKELQEFVDSPFLLGHSVRQGKDVRLQDWICVGGGVRLGDGVQLKRCVVWDDSVLPDGVLLQDDLIAGE